MGLGGGARKLGNAKVAHDKEEEERRKEWQKGAGVGGQSEK